MKVGFLLVLVFIIWSYCSNLAYRMTYGRPLRWYLWPFGSWAVILERRLRSWER